MKYLLLFSLVVTSAFAKDNLSDFNQRLLEKFDKDIKTDNDLSLKKEKGPTRGPASVAPEKDVQHVDVENKIDRSVRQTGHKDW
ncbi:MAG: hypothetical protein ACJ76H_12610 [Bacteriovoracaceae bacterium]